MNRPRASDHHRRARPQRARHVRPRLHARRRAPRRLRGDRGGGGAGGGAAWPAGGRRRVDAACGFGRFAEALSRHGIDADGIDISPAAIAEAQRRCPGPRYLVHDLTQPLPEGVGPFDLLVNVYSSFGYGVTESEDQQMLACLHRCAAARRLDRDAAERPRALAHRLRSDAEPVVRWTNGVKETLTVGFATGELHVRYELDNDVVHSRIRMYERERPVEMFEQAGFSDVSPYGDFTGKPKEPADRLVLVARA